LLVFLFFVLFLKHAQVHLIFFTAPFQKDPVYFETAIGRVGSLFVNSRCSGVAPCMEEIRRKLWIIALSGYMELVSTALDIQLSGRTHLTGTSTFLTAIT
jgi:hypothetical protein